MSGKIKAKDLSYDSSLPPFLQRLHEQNAGRGDQDRHERSLARPKREKAHDEEDEPTVVDEAGETLSKADVVKLTGNTGEDGDPIASVREEVNCHTVPMASGAIPDGGGGSKRGDQKVTDGTAVKKRKVAKVVGDDDVDDQTANVGTALRTDVKKPKKKAKPIKLAFDNDEAA